MVVINIITKNQNQADEIIEYLLSKNLIISAVEMEKVRVYKKDENRTIQSENKILIMGKTKALLFNTIDKQLRKLFGSNMPELYSVPIVSMDWDQANELVEQTAVI